MKTIQFLRTLILVTIVLFFALQRGNGFGFLFLLLIFMATTISSLVSIIRGPAERKRHCLRIGIWAAAVTLTSAVQIYWNADSRDNAARVAGEIQAHRARTGSYPPALAEIGLDEQEVRARWKIGYFWREGRPVLAYPSSFMPLTSYEYDFQTHKWMLNAY